MTFPVGLVGYSNAAGRTAGACSEGSISKSLRGRPFAPRKKQGKWCEFRRADAWRWCVSMSGGTDPVCLDQQGLEAFILRFGCEWGSTADRLPRCRLNNRPNSRRVLTIAHRVMYFCDAGHIFVRTRGRRPPHTRASGGLLH